MAEREVPTVRRPSLIDAVVPLVAPAVLIASSLALFGLDALDGPLQVALSMLLYLPYAIFCYASPALSVLYGATGFKIEKVEPVALDPSPGRSD